MIVAVTRSNGPLAESERYRLKPRFDSSDAVVQERFTAPSPPPGAKDARVTAVVWAASALENSEELPNAAQTVPSVHAVVVAVIMSVPAPATALLKEK